MPRERDAGVLLIVALVGIAMMLFHFHAAFGAVAALIRVREVQP
jgi:hypothetical protein